MTHAARRLTTLVATAALAACVALLAPARDAAAQPAAPTPEQLDQAREAFQKGQKAIDAGKLDEAVTHFKESYRLSRNPLLLYNLGLTFERMSNVEMALFYFRKFVADAPAETKQRPDAIERIAALEKAAGIPDANDPFAGGNVTATGGGSGDAGDGGEPPRPRRRGGAFTVDDFEHKVVDEAPPGKPLDITAYVPEESGWTATLYYRSAGEEKYATVAMRPRYNEVVGRIPARRMTGTTVQYYLELKDAGGETLTRIGKPTSPNVVFIDADARPRFYPDLDDDGAGGGAAGGGTIGGDDGGGAGGGMWGRRRSGSSGPGLTDVQSSKFQYAKWGATGTGLGMLTLSMTFYLLAQNAASELESEAALSNDPQECASRPCFTYDQYYRDLAAYGQRNETLSKVTLGIGIAATGVAAWFWYQEIKAQKKAERTGTAARAPRGLDSLVATPVAGDDFLGGAAALRF